VIDVPPPYPPAVECISPDSPALVEVKTYLTLSGDPLQVGAIVEEARKHPWWRLDADTEANHIRFIRFSASNVPYRSIGALMFEAQRRQLSISLLTEPSICRPEID
jgi:hypothetical protein